MEIFHLLQHGANSDFCKAWSDGSKEWTTEVQEELDHTFGSDSTFWISYEDLMRKYQHFDRTRLFRDPDWRSCQRWIGAEVTWKPQYNEKFHIKLTKDSPLVLVLSQLDDRYFRGLQGQYNFRLQFRLHEEGRPGAEEYVVRSHGNYLMDRSVSVEIPSLSAGNYAAFISIVGERDTRLASTEAVVKQQCKRREENEKLAQVGLAYDLAHSKAAAHLARLSKVRKTAESRKASEMRCKERRKNWEKRQTMRLTSTKQREKDGRKKAQQKAEKKAKVEAAAKEAAEKTAAEEERKKQTEQELNADNASAMSNSSSTGSPLYTPKSEPACLVEDDKKAVAVPPAEASQHSATPGGPPAPQLLQAIHSCGAASAGGQTPLELKLHYCSCNTCKPPPRIADSDDYSSDSPVEDFELLYDEDDVTPTLRLAGAAPVPASAVQDSEDEDVPDPWNAIAVIGFRVYSKDENLELRVVMEGGELEQDGMGNLGEADLDNAVSNAAGQREKKQEEGEGGKKPDESGDKKSVEGAANDPQIPEVSVTGPGGADGTERKMSVVQQEGNVTASAAATAAGMASYRTIIERQTSEYDRVIGKAMVGQKPASASASADDDSKTTTTVPADAATTTTTTGDVELKVAPSKDYTPSTTTTATPAIDNAVIERVTAAPSHPTRPDTREEKTFKEVQSYRHMLQRGLFRGPGNEHPLGDMREMSEIIARLEAVPDADLTADVIRRTRIYKVLRAILPWKGASGGQGVQGGAEEDFGIGERLLALADDLELTLVTAKMEEMGKEGGNGVVKGEEDGQRGQQSGYFDLEHAGQET